MQFGAVEVETVSSAETQLATMVRQMRTNSVELRLGALD